MQSVAITIVLCSILAVSAATTARSSSFLDVVMRELARASSVAGKAGEDFYSRGNHREDTQRAHLSASSFLDDIARELVRASSADVIAGKEKEGVSGVSSTAKVTSETHLSTSGLLGNTATQLAFSDVEMATSQLVELEPGPIGYLYHRTSRKAIHPYEGSTSPADDTNIVIHDGTGEFHLQFRFIPVEGEGHFGFIEHVASGAVIQPRGGSTNPESYTELVLHRSRHRGALFTFDEENEKIIHIGGRLFTPWQGAIYPPNGAKIILHSYRLSPNSGFYLGNAQGNKTSAYPPPLLNFHWILLGYFENNIANEKFTKTTQEGLKRQGIDTSEPWSISQEIANGWFACSEFPNFVQDTEYDETWGEEQLVSIELGIPPGEPIAFWQLVCEMEQYGEHYSIKSSITKTTKTLW